MPEGNTPAGIDGHAPVLARDEILVQARIDAIWQLHTDVDNRPTWQKDITVANLAGRFEPGASFEWTSAGFTVTSTIYDFSPPTADVSPRARTLWGGTAQGITGIHEWTFTDMTQGVVVATSESFAGAPIDSDPSTMQDILDTSLVSWLLHLKAAAEATA